MLRHAIEWLIMDIQYIVRPAYIIMNLQGLLKNYYLISYKISNSLSVGFNNRVKQCRLWRPILYIEWKFITRLVPAVGIEILVLWKHFSFISELFLPLGVW